MELSGRRSARNQAGDGITATPRGHSLFVRDVPRTVSHPVDVERLIVQLHGLAKAGNKVIVISHDLDGVAVGGKVVEMRRGQMMKGTIHRRRNTASNHHGAERSDLGVLATAF